MARCWHAICGADATPRVGSVLKITPSSTAVVDAALAKRLKSSGHSTSSRSSSGRGRHRRAPPCEVDAVDALGWTAAHVATLDGNVAALRALLGAGANVHTRDVNGYDPLMAAAECGRPEALRLLLAHGARIGATNLRGRPALLSRAHGAAAPTAERRPCAARSVRHASAAANGIVQVERFHTPPT
jgi:hypothetical protein